MSIAIFFGFFSSLLLAIWSIPIGLQWFAYFSSRVAIAFGPLSMAWANEICSGDAEERVLVLGMMNCLAYTFNAWLPLLTYPATDAPRFKTGFIFSTCACGVLLGITGLVALLQKREGQKRETREQSGRTAGGGDIWEDEI
jgi:ACS family pantothenate transporter-like MFS transporter